jgi:hypothetical protein
MVRDVRSGREVRRKRGEALAEPTRVIQVDKRNL